MFVLSQEASKADISFVCGVQSLEKVIRWQKIIENILDKGAQEHYPVAEP